MKTLSTNPSMLPHLPRWRHQHLTLVQPLVSALRSLSPLRWLRIRRVLRHLPPQIAISIAVKPKALTPSQLAAIHGPKLRLRSTTSARGVRMIRRSRRMTLFRSSRKFFSGGGSSRRSDIIPVVPLPYSSKPYPSPCIGPLLEPPSLHNLATTTGSFREHHRVISWPQSCLLTLRLG